jgi:hypothetical protein
MFIGYYWFYLLYEYRHMNKIPAGNGLIQCCIDILDIRFRQMTANFCQFPVVVQIFTQVIYKIYLKFGSKINLFSN